MKTVTIQIEDLSLREKHTVQATGESYCEAGLKCLAMLNAKFDPTATRIVITNQRELESRLAQARKIGEGAP